MIDKRDFMKLRLSFIEMTTEFGMVLMLAMEKKPIPNSKRVKDKWAWVWDLSKKQCEELSKDILEAVNQGLRSTYDLHALQAGPAAREEAYEAAFQNLSRLMNELNAKFGTWQMMSAFKPISSNPNADEGQKEAI